MAAVAAKQPVSKAAREFDAALKQLRLQEMAALRMQRLVSARTKLIDFTTMSMPDPEDPNDPDRSRYKPALHHHLIAQALEKVETGAWPRLIITMPPRHGKSELATKRFPAWFTGHDPYRQTIVAAYSDEFSQEFGREVREIMRSPFYQQVFPGAALRTGSASSGRIQTTAGGILTFIGRSGGGTGKGADLLIIDDPVKNREEADSPTIRNSIWNWFTDVAMTRLTTDAARVIIIMTRWHEDDLVGRLTDPHNEHYNSEAASKWRLLQIPAIAGDNDPLRRAPGAALWPERIGIDFLMGQKELNLRSFEALYQGNPSPEDGDFFRKEWITRGAYQPLELPDHLRIYIASDHAVSTEQERDATCCVVGGVDRDGVLWILPDIYWRRAQTDGVVEGMLDLGGRMKPLIWWAEKGHISKSIGPFLRKRMMETNTYFRIEEVSAAKDKMTRAQAIQGRMAMGKVRYPTFAPWWGEAERELLKFSGGTSSGGNHDDFVDALAHLGGGLARMVSADRGNVTDIADKRPATGTLAWVKASAKHIRDQARNKGGF